GGRVAGEIGCAVAAAEDHATGAAAGVGPDRGAGGGGLAQAGDPRAGGNVGATTTGAGRNDPAARAGAYQQKGLPVQFPSAPRRYAFLFQPSPALGLVVDPAGKGELL